MATEINDKKVEEYLNKVNEKADSISTDVVKEEPAGFKDHISDMTNELMVILPILGIIIGTIAITTGTMWVIRKILLKLGVKNQKVYMALTAITAFITFSALKKLMENDESMQEMAKNLYDGTNETLHKDDQSMLDAFGDIKIPGTEKKE